ncbi:hypothetical protein CNMCM5793_005625 [Aspergillus hiratsukae]|uniref:Reverse transcriptase Ty1/copia-type domain-containing protein n=1 Tax=Aspergillus hiratsukae TaxID=1194566 RepID=A0A8H6QEY7_9EURO|nr:hypothetical protein CNMCM5793_005625 [Aspergillus hiratsukae]KAF7171866.1 hypothetical protein CNMCM6106_006236 [Aspergillus hiratsukae]
MREKTIEILHSSRYTDEQKGKTERAGRTIIEMAPSMRTAARLPEKLWPHIVRAAVYLHNRRPRREIVEQNGQKSWIWITPYEKLYGKKPSLANLRVYGFRAVPGYLVGFTASNIWQIWNPLTGKITDERDVVLDEDKLYDPYNRFLAGAIKIPDLPEPPVEFNELPDIEFGIELRESSDGEEMDEVEARGVRIVNNEVAEVPNSESGVLNEASGQATGQAESPKRELGNLTPPTPESTPMRPLQHDEPIESIDPPRERPAPLGFMTPRSPTRIADSPEPDTPVRLADTLPESPGRLEPDIGDEISRDSPSKQLFKEVNRLSIDPTIEQDVPDRPDDADDIPRRPKHSVSADLFEENIIPGKRPRRAPRYAYTATCIDSLTKLHSVFAAFGKGILGTQESKKQPNEPKKRLHRDEIPPPPNNWKEVHKHPLKELFLAAAELEQPYELDEEVYTWMAEGFSEYGYVYQLQRALYGLRKSPRLWQKELSKAFKELGLQRINADFCLYTDDKVVVLVFVDDILFLYRPESKKHADSLIRKLQGKYEFRNLGEGDNFLGIKITRDRAKRKLWLSQRAYIDKIVARYHLDSTNRKPHTPAIGELKPYDGKATIDEIHHYQSQIGSILYAAVISRLDIAKITSDLVRYLLNSGPAHFDAANRVILYLAATRDYVLEYGGDLKGDIVIIASDAAYGDQMDRSSSEGYLVMLFGAAVDWRTGEQRRVTTSTTEAELLALTEAAKNVFWWKRLFLDIGFDPEHEISILQFYAKSLDPPPKTIILII